MKIRRLFFNFVFVLLALTSLIGAVAAVYYQSSFLVVTSGSMEPTIKAGDMVLVRRIQTREVKKDDVLVLPVPDSPGLRYAHRVISVSQELNGLVLKTQGDANPNPDAWSIAVKDRRVPKVVMILPTSIFLG